MTSHIFNFHFQLLLGALFCALEGQVLQKVSNAVVLGRLVSRSGINPDTNGRRLTADHRLGRHTQTRVEGGHIGGGRTEDVVGKVGSRRCGGGR